MKESEKLELGQKVKNEELAELASLIDAAADSINEFVKCKKPLEKYKNIFMSATEGDDYEVKITVSKRK